MKKKNEDPEQILGHPIPANQDYLGENFDMESVFEPEEEPEEDDDDNYEEASEEYHSDVGSNHGDQLQIVG